jgi:hypothetical protein
MHNAVNRFRRETVSTSLLAKADGMFLWVKLMLVDLQRAATDDETTRRLTDLPHGLEEAYRHILTRLVTRIDKHQQQLVRLISVLLTTCGRQLETEELRYAYGMMVEPESESTLSTTSRFLLRRQPEQFSIFVEACRPSARVFLM